MESELKRQKWDLSTIGFDVKGSKDFTGLFVQALKVPIRVQPAIRFGFCQALDEFYDTMKRVLMVLWSKLPHSSHGRRWLCRFAPMLANSWRGWRFTA